MQTRSTSLPLQTRRAEPTSYDARSRTFEAVAISGQDVRRFYGIERMAASAASFEIPSPLMNSHHHNDVREILGKVTNVRIENGQAIATFELDEGHADIERMLK